MTARGIKVSYSTDASYCFFGRTGISIPCSSNIQICAWMHVNGNNGNRTGQIPFSLYDSSNDETLYLADGGADDTPWGMTGIVFSSGSSSYGPPSGGSMATGENWWVMCQWDAAAGKWTTIVMKDGDPTEHSAVESTGHANAHTFNRLKVGCSETFTGGLGSNMDVGVVKLWSGGSLFNQAQRLAEKKSVTAVISSNLYLAWPMANSSDTSDGSGNSRTPTATINAPGTLTNGTMDPVDLQGGGAATKIRVFQRIEDGACGAATSSLINGHLLT